MASDDRWQMVPETPGVVVKTTHVYTYKSAVYGRGTLLLHSYGGEDTQTIEYMSTGAGLTAAHGRWRIDNVEGVLRVEFNCRQGCRTPPQSRDTWPLHPAIFWRGSAFIDRPEDAEWAGIDDKGISCWLIHIRSIRNTMAPGEAPAYEMVAGL